MELHLASGVRLWLSVTGWRLWWPFLCFLFSQSQLHVAKCWSPQYIIIFFVNVVMLLLLLLSCFSRVRLCATPSTAAHQAPPSLGFSRQEHWSGLPFPSPMREKVKMKLLSRVWLLETSWTAAYQTPPSMGFSRQEYWSGVPLPSPEIGWG